MSCPRIPCATFSVHLGEQRWLPRFTAARVPGAYLRVLRSGQVRAGDAVHVRDVPEHGVDIGTAFAALTTSPELLPLLRGVPQLPAEDQDAVRRRLDRSSAR